MKERPILFSGPMVRAILDGTKTQTRRIIKCIGRWDEDARVYKAGIDYAVFRNVKCPYGVVGDRFWVRETWKPHCHETEWTGIKYRADDAFMKPTLWSDEQGAWCEEHENEKHWRPSIFMPRWASRITLEITGLRAERLQGISESDCYAEGITDEEIGIGAANAAYLGLWDRINGKGAASSNPWVWVLEFRRIAN